MQEDIGMKKSIVTRVMAVVLATVMAVSPVTANAQKIVIAIEVKMI